MRRTLSQLGAAVHRARLITYNVKMLPFGGEDNAQRARRIAKHFAAADIVCLQELFEGDVRQFLVDEAAREYSLSERAEGPPSDWLSGHFVSGGLCILTRYDIVQSHYAEFEASSQVGFDALANKGVAHALLQVDQYTRMHVFTAHTQSGRSYEESVGRDMQIQHIAEFIRQHTEADEHPVLLVGDLNVDAFAKDRSYDFMMETLRSELSSYVVVDESAQAGATFPETGEKFDYVISARRRKLTSEPATYKTYLKPWSESDHLALGVEITLK